MQRLESVERLVFTPSLSVILLQLVPLDMPLVRQVGGRTVTPYDDRFILDHAAKKGGVVVSRDNYRDLVQVDS